MQEDLIRLGEQTIEALKAVHELIAPMDGLLSTGPHWEKNLSRDLPAITLPESLGQGKITGCIEAAVHLTRGSAAPLDDFHGDPEETQYGYATFQLKGSVAGKLARSVPGSGGLSAGVGISAGSELKITHHRRTLLSENGLAALEGLLGNLRDPFDPSSMDKLAEFEVAQLDLGATLALQASAGWKEGWTRTWTDPEEIKAPKPVKFACGASARATVTAKLSGSFQARILRSPTRPGWVRVRVHKRKGNFVGVGLSLKAEARFDGVGDWVEGWLDRVPNLPSGNKNTQNYKELKEKLEQNLKSSVEKGLRASIEASINRSHSHEALLDVDIDLEDCHEAYRRILRGDFTPALEKDRAGGANGVEINECVLRDVLRKERTLSIRLNLFGLDWERDLQRVEEVEVIEEKGTLQITGTGGAELHQKSRKDSEGTSLLFDLEYLAESGPIDAAHLERMSARFSRKISATKADDIESRLRWNLKAAVEFGLLDPERAGELGTAILEKEGPYEWSLSVECPPPALRRLFRLQEDLDEDSYMKLLWNTLMAALQIDDCPLPATKAGSPCPMRLLVGPRNIATITRWPDRANDPVHLHDIDQPSNNRLTTQGAKLFWGYMALAFYYFRALSGLRGRLQRGLSGGTLSGDLKEFSKCAADFRNQVGSLHGRTFEALHLTLPLLADPALCDIRMTFQRDEGDRALRIEV